MKNREAKGEQYGVLVQVTFLTAIKDLRAVYP